MKRTFWRKVAATLIVGLGFAFLTILYALDNRGVKPGRFPNYIEYWSTSHRIVEGADPYDRPEMLRLQQSEGFDGNAAILAFSFPGAFALLLPLGFVSAETGRILWSMALFSSIALTLRLLWSLHGKPDSKIHLLGFLFAPVIVCFITGQIGIFFGLGITLFLYLYQKHPAWAGAALLPCSMKPHLFFVVGIVLLLWCFRRKSFAVLGGLAIAYLISSAIVMSFDPHIWSQYARFWATGETMGVPTPCFGSALRMAINPRSGWIEFVPSIVGCVWGVWYFQRNREEWDWMQCGLVVLFVSEMCAPYSWLTDEAMFVPAILAGMLRLKTNPMAVLPLVLTCGIALFQVLHGFDIKTYAYIWTTPAWLACFLIASLRAKPLGSHENAAVI